MPAPSFMAVEFIAFLSAGAMVYEAWRLGTAALATLFAGMMFGFAIEVFFVTQYAGYAYGDFLIDPPVWGHSVPLWVAAGWGTIIYISMAATDRMGFQWYFRPLLDGLLAVSLDLTLDPIAEATGWWHWVRPGQFFGVPCDNFIGWLLIVSSFSFFLRLGFHFFPRGLHTWRDVLIPLTATLPAVGVVAGAQVVLERVYPHLGEPLTFILLASLFLGISTWAACTAQAVTPPQWFLTAVPGAYHGLMLVLLLLTGFGLGNPEALVGLPLAAISSLFAFRFPRWHHG